ncbi:MAG: HDOD domain-containing protein [Planctomycetota bacterium]|jgi:signal transduction histidine kinase/HD-like signal output (HDOD) protein
MSQTDTERNKGRQVELSVGRQECLSILPCVATGLFSQLLSSGSPSSSPAEMIESDPILAARFFSLIHQERINFTDVHLSISRALGQISAAVIRDGFLSLKVYPAFSRNNVTSQFRKQLTLHSLATACCAKKIAGIISTEPEIQMAYLAGLMHNIGNFALDESMPKSFERIVTQARTEQADLKTLQKKYIGIDYTILGKRLATRWHVPEEIINAIWLHRSEIGQIVQGIPGTHIAQIVRISDLISRQCGIGESGNYDPIEQVEQLAESLGIGREHLDNIRSELPSKVAEKAELLNLDLTDEVGEFCDVVQTAAAKMAKEQSSLASDNRKLQSDSSHFNFIIEFLSGIDTNLSATEIAEDFAIRWQKFYQTGMVCVYLPPRSGQDSVDAIIVESLAKSRVLSLNIPAEIIPVPRDISNKFSILDAQDYDTDWLFEQMKVKFNLSQTKLLPLLCGGKTVGVLVFELRYPGDTELFEAKFKASATAAGTVLNMATSASDRQSLSEELIELIHKPAEISQPVVTDAPKIAQQENSAENYSIATLAEMAAGAAHELNNPLSVISGRAQLLSDQETDVNKTQMLKNIQDNATEITQIIDDLMAFAEPPKPRKTSTHIKQIIDEAVQLTLAKTDFDRIDTEIQINEGLKDVNIDSAQIVSAIANILTNALESYQYEIGPVKITAEPDESGDFIKLHITDTGCGMSHETLAKSTQPFFSSKPAGRKRGMGLAQAARLVKLNNGSLKIKSTPDQGTTVTISLPCQ